MYKVGKNSGFKGLKRLGTCFWVLGIVKAIKTQMKYHYGLMSYGCSLVGIGIYRVIITKQ